MQTEKRAKSKPRTTIKARVKTFLTAKKNKAPAKRAKSGLSGSTMSRLEARIPTDLYEEMERAAELRGLTMTSYVTAIMGDDARRTISENSIIRLSIEEQLAFANALINPPEPNAKLLAAKRRHAEMIGQ